MTADARGTREKILKNATELVQAGGVGALTFDAVAKRLGVSKQAVIYWFPTKDDLIAAVAVPSIRAESEAALAAMKGAPRGAAAIRAFVRALAEFHFADLDRFRLLYVAPQSGLKPGMRMTERLGDQVHALTSAVYDELQAHVMLATGLAGIESRRRAVAIDMAALGLVLTVAVTDAMGDPLLHDRNDMVETMADLLAGRVRAETQRATPSP